MSSDYSYDDTNSHFPFFMLTMVGLVTVPLTYNILKPSTDLEHTAQRIRSDFKPKDDAIIEAERRKEKKRARKTKRTIAVVLGYAFMAYMAYLIVTTQRTIPKVWDPYDILGVSRSATEKEIDRFYKRLSVKFHPDKARPNAANNETVESINDRWVEMTKAYKALTDEEIRNNYLMYGHPDGKQSTSIGIAIPKWVIEEHNRAFVVLFYAGLLGVFLPYTVGKWWYGTQALTKDKVLHASAGNLFREWKEDITEGGILAALSSGDEFKEILSGNRADHGAAKLETKVLQSGLLHAKDVEKLQSISDPLRRKVLCLLWAYVGRLELGDEELEKQKYEVAPIARNLNQAFASITLPFLNVNPLIHSYQASQNVIQAVSPNGSPLLQLPNFTAATANKIQASLGARPTIQKLMELSPATRRNLCSDLSDSQYKEAMQVVSQIPYFRIEAAFFKVVGERVVTPGSLVHLVVKGRIIPPGTTDIPPVDPLDLEDIDPDEGDVGALRGKPAKSKRRKDGDGNWVEDDSKEDSVQPPLTFAPYFASDYAPRWHIFLSEPRASRIAVPPFTFTAFDRPIFTPEGKPTFKVQTLKCQFQAPNQVHAFPFTMNLICDSYIGFDGTSEVLLDVKDVSEASVVEQEEEISEPDEDTIAGQLQAMKSGGVTGAPPKRKKRVQEETSDDESDTEGDIETDSETNTETEPEN